MNTKILGKPSLYLASFVPRHTVPRGVELGLVHRTLAHPKIINFSLVALLKGKFLIIQPSLLTLLLSKANKRRQKCKSCYSSHPF